MKITEIIEKKKNKCALGEEEIDFFVRGVSDGSIADYQISALLMAICINGMTERETAVLTYKMAHSGATLDLSALAPTADKHSTGGVGDKTSLIVAPIAAANGVNIAKMSGRGLGHTGGTIDKLESIPGFNSELEQYAFLEQVKRIGIAIIAQSEALVPADKILYALRDVTATIDSVPLIASSIMSKKLAAGADIIELDVKTGSGAFMKTEKEATALARTMVTIGQANGKKTCALITDMNTPLGMYIGNSLEIIEVIDVLNNRGAADLKELCIALAANIIHCAKGVSEQQARTLALRALENGAALEKFRQMVAAQGGDAGFIDHPERFEKAAFHLEIPAPCDGYISAMNCEAIGNCAAMLGAGRTKKTDRIDSSAGIVLGAKTGAYVKKGSVLATLFTNRAENLENVKNAYLEALTISVTPPKQQALIKAKL